ncbi:Transcription factor TGA4 [Zea mays]|uniref:Transcription factor TGA4 n=1 Tax=Zea mays TaxID=4577 RepID=A0A1D6JFC4_MAIZE|nr:Transcription factor TGA4 [Zea mays]AQK46483.1 Transcription factor TGA4 [Zea mays]
MELYSGYLDDHFNPHKLRRRRKKNGNVLMAMSNQSSEQARH